MLTKWIGLVKWSTKRHENVERFMEKWTVSIVTLDWGKGRHTYVSSLCHLMRAVSMILVSIHFCRFWVVSCWLDFRNKRDASAVASHPTSLNKGKASMWFSRKVRNKRTVTVEALFRWNVKKICDGILLIWSTKWSLFTKIFAQMGCKLRDESNDAN